MSWILGEKQAAAGWGTDSALRARVWRFGLSSLVFFFFLIFQTAYVTLVNTRPVLLFYFLRIKTTVWARTERQTGWTNPVQTQKKPNKSRMTPYFPKTNVLSRILLGQFIGLTVSKLGCENGWVRAWAWLAWWSARSSRGAKSRGWSWVRPSSWEVAVLDRFRHLE